MAPPRAKARGRGRGRGSTLPRGGGGRDRSNYDGGLETQNIPDSAIDQPENDEGEDRKSYDIAPSNGGWTTKRGLTYAPSFNLF